MHPSEYLTTHIVYQDARVRFIRRRNNTTRWIGMFFCCFLGATGGCSSWRTDHQIYTGPHRSGGEVALLKGGDPVRIYEIDGKSGPNFQGLGFPPMYNSKWNGRFHIELLPGVHTLVIGYFLGPPGTKMTTIRVEAGKVYNLSAIVKGSDWKTNFTEADE